MKIIIAGTRDFNNYDVLKNICDTLFRGLHTVEIVSGNCRGADMLGERYANENNIKLTKFPADWNTYGKRAGYIRNTEMALYSDALIAFWDNKSKGTKMMIDIARGQGLKVDVFDYKKYPDCA